jgi:hypothetical protein
MIDWVVMTIAGGGLNRARGWGGSQVPNVIWAVIWGLMLGWYTFGQDALLVGVFALLFTAGSRPGWGHPVGQAVGDTPNDKYEKWQVGFLRKNITAALATRGAIWAAPVLPLAYFNPEVLLLLLAMAVGFTVGPNVSSRVIPNDPQLLENLKKRWEWGEVVTGAVSTAIYVGLVG